MTERQLKYGAGMALILSHVAIILMIIGFRFVNGFNTDEFTTLLALVTPMFSGYTASIIAFVVTDRHVSADTSQPVTGAFIALTLLLPLLLAGLTVVAIAVKAYNLVFTDFEDCKRFLIALESIFAVYVGMLIYALFPRQDISEPSSAKNNLKREP
jgi:membrane-associated protease RseP (regulator of RpoE activity)